MARDKVLKEKDRVQKRLWKEAGRDARSYTKLIHKKATELGKAGKKIDISSR